MARFANMADFSVRYPELADLLGSDEAEGNSFLQSMKRKIANRENLSPKMISAMRKIAETEFRDFEAGQSFTSTEVQILREATREGWLDVMFLWGQLGRIQTGFSQLHNIHDRLEALARGECLTGFFDGHVTWVSPDKRFPLLEGSFSSLSTVKKEAFEATVQASQRAEETTPTQAFEKRFEATETKLERDKDEREVQSESEPVSKWQCFLPKFDDWQKAPGFR